MKEQKTPFSSTIVILPFLQSVQRETFRSRLSATSSRSLHKFRFLRLLSLAGRAKKKKEINRKKNWRKYKQRTKGKKIKKGKRAFEIRETEPRIFWRITKNIFFRGLFSTRKKKKEKTLYSLYKCRAGASVADQIDLPQSDKRRHFFFFFVIESRLGQEG